MRRNRLLLMGLVTALLGVLMGGVALAAEDTVAPVLLDAYPLATAYDADDTVELVLVFREAGGINLRDTVIHLQMVDSPSPVSTRLYLMDGDINGTVMTNVTASVCTPAQVANGYYAVKVAVPMHYNRDNFMTGTYVLDSLAASDLSGNRCSYGVETESFAGGPAIPTSQGLTFTVDNPGADCVSPVVRSIALTPDPVAAGQALTMTVKAYAPDGVAEYGFGYTLSVYDDRLPNGSYQYYPDAAGSDLATNISAPDADGVVTVTSTVTVPNTVPPGQYRLSQFCLRDTAGNETINSRIYPVIAGYDDIGVTIVNDAYDYSPAADITGLSLSADTARPGDTLAFRVTLDSQGVAMEQYMDVHLTNGLGVNFDTFSVNRQTDGSYRGEYRVPADLLPQTVELSLSVRYANGTWNDVSAAELSVKNLPTRFTVGSVFAGLDDLSLPVGATADNLMAGVTAASSLDGDLTGQITIANAPDLTVPGVYFVRYEAPSTMPVEEWNPDKGMRSYVGYRWVGVTEWVPTDEDDPFVAASSALAIGGAKADDVTVRYAASGSNYHTVAFAARYTSEGSYQLQRSGDSNGQGLLCDVGALANGQYQVAFDANGGKGTMAPKVWATGESRALPKAAFTRTGYAFDGWALSADGKVVYANQAMVKDLAQSGVVVLYARWKGLPFAIAATSANEAWGTVTGAGTYQYDNTAVVKATPKQGYRFVRWLEGSKAVSTGASYSFKVAKARTLKAEFAAIATLQVKALVGYDSVCLSWGMVTTGDCLIYQATKPDGAFAQVGKGAPNGCDLGGLITGKTYYYRVRIRCVAATATTYGPYSATVAVTPTLATPKAKAASAGYTSVKLTWGKVDGAMGYKVYRATSKTGTYQKVADTNVTSYTNGSLSTGKTYYYKVRAYRKVDSAKVYSAYSPVISARPVPSKTTDVTAHRVSNSSIKVSWGRVSGATKYQVYRATKKDGKYTKVAETTKLGYTNKKLANNKTYYYKVRAYHLEAGKKVYGAWSAVVSARP